MCQTISACLSSSSAVARRSCQCRKDGPQRHGLRIDSSHACNSRTNPLAQAVLVEPGVHKREYVSNRAYLHPLFGSWPRRSRFGFERHTYFAEAPRQVAHGLLKQQLALIEERDMRRDAVDFAQFVG